MKILIAFFSLVFIGFSSDYVTNMPYWPESYPFDLFSGYLNITGTEKAIHYMFITSQNNPSKDPVLLWLNGGPGCSSLMGLVGEIGPFVFENGQTELNGSLNPWSWNKNASIIFLESPAGVGFSIANISNENYDDETTMLDQYSALQLFFARYPNFTNQAFWIGGESYAGIYIPNLAVYIDQMNNNASIDGIIKINLKGIIVGNGVTIPSTPNKYSLIFNSQMGIIPNNIYSTYSLSCTKDSNSAGCGFATSYIGAMLKNVNLYDIFGYCYPIPSINNSSNQINPAEELIKAKKNVFYYTPWSIANEFVSISDPYEASTVLPCVFSAGAMNYWNNLTVKEAIHVDTNIQWDDCNDQIYEKYNSSSNGTYSDYPYLKSKGYKILVYSGNIDSIVSFLDTSAWISQLGWERITPTKAWYVGNSSQIAGWINVFNGLSYAIINGAGHMAAQDKRFQAYQLFASFVHDIPL